MSVVAAWHKEYTETGCLLCCILCFWSHLNGDFNGKSLACFDVFLELGQNIFRQKLSSAFSPVWTFLCCRRQFDNLLCLHKGGPCSKINNSSLVYWEQIPVQHHCFGIECP
ncbi:hypothetical protein AW736_13105 [Termitidicoccus mucosus]|uniref:Uncharacterized protein n=1 Tax=Termitidicoccus mucosus TaxID=1184151 RepID=A0A178IIC9_9BACT|nr:hypothetical protein AW736_13105 [Opitutaceae bacterium TSB47]